MSAAPRKQPRIIETDLGREQRCSKCREYWPADTEFFHQLRDRLSSWCKACCTALKVERGACTGTGRARNDHVRAEDAQ